MHLNEEALILHYYGESDDRGQADQHLAACQSCRVEFLRLQQVLALVDAQDIPEPPPSFERTVWARLEPQLAAPARGAWLQRWFGGSPRLAWAGGIGVLVLAAFVAGRFSGSAPTPQPSPVTTSAAATERVLVVAVVDHLDRSQMMLVELLNSDAADAASGSGQERARDLVAANRLYRQSVVQAGDSATNEVLEDLERILLEIANAPANGTSIDLQVLRDRIESRGLLFRVRVVQSEMRERERQSVIAGSTS